MVVVFCEVVVTTGIYSLSVIKILLQPFRIPFRIVAVTKNCYSVTLPMNSFQSVHRSNDELDI